MSAKNTEKLRKIAAAANEEKNGKGAEGESGEPQAFGVALDVLMERQAAEDADADVPLVLPLMIKNILDNGAMQTEGLFRSVPPPRANCALFSLDFLSTPVSLGLFVNCWVWCCRVPGENNQIMALKATLDAGELSINSTDVHSIGGLFKLWLRELPEPLVGNEF